MEQQQIQAINEDQFNAFLEVNGYIDPRTGVMNIKLREAQALWLQQDIVTHKNTIETSFVSISLDLWEIYSQQLWAELDFRNFEEFLASPEVDLSKSVGYGLQKIGELIVTGVVSKDKAIEVGPSRMRTLLPVIKDQEQIVVDEWLDKASELTNLDLQDEVAGHEIARYSGSGKLADIIEELRTRNEFWEGEVYLHVRTT